MKTPSYVDLIKFIRHYGDTGLLQGKILAEALIKSGLVECDEKSPRIKYHVGDRYDSSTRQTIHPKKDVPL